MAVKKILVTCFEPFGQNAVNTSREAVMRMRAPQGTTVKKVCLPVTWDGAPKALVSEIDSFGPDAILMTGLASGAEFIRVERVAINICGQIKDNDGKFPSENGERPIVSGGENAYFSSFDHKKILAALKNEGIRSAYSFSAGTYICNLILYIALKKTVEDGSGVKAGFIHVPDADEFALEGRASMALDTITRAVEIAAENI